MVDRRDNTSVLMFKSNKGIQSDDKYTVQPDDTVIHGTYKNMFQYVTMPCLSQMQLNRSLHDSVSLITDSRQLIMSITSDVTKRTYHRDVLKLRSFDDVEQCSILAIRSIKA